MPVLTSGNTIYTRPVAKVMISIPDGLLRRIDDYARSRRETRSGFLQRIAEREIVAANADRRQEVEKLLDLLSAESLDGNAAQLIREDRDAR
jgi:hypothetical protein